MKMSPSLEYILAPHKNQSFCIHVDTAKTNLLEFKQ